MTILAFGCTAGDYFTNTSLAKMGYSIMAITACYAGELYNQIVGFGLSLFIATIKSKDKIINFKIFTPETKNTYGYLCCIILAAIIISELLNKIITLILLYIHSYNYNQRVG